jgi:hypothetical protein
MPTEHWVLSKIKFAVRTAASIADAVYKKQKPGDENE